MNDEVTVVKLGGSVVTYKDVPFTPNLEAIKRLSREIAAAKVSALVVVHGGGSFGHPVAKKYDIKGGYQSPSQILGYAETHQAMVKLNEIIIESLLNNNIAAFEVTPSSFIITKHGRIRRMNIDLLSKMLQLGLTPVLYGDAVLDSQDGFTILSGDQLVSSIALALGAKNVLIAADVDGLYTADPKLSSTASLIRNLSLEELKSKIKDFGAAETTDVTGGMLGKITELLPAIEEGLEVKIVNALTPNNLYKALRSEDVAGTLIRRH